MKGEERCVWVCVGVCGCVGVGGGGVYVLLYEL
jgi:hypothetical protein